VTARKTEKELDRYHMSRSEGNGINLERSTTVFSKCDPMRLQQGMNKSKAILDFLNYSHFARYAQTIILQHRL